MMETSFADDVARRLMTLPAYLERLGDDESGLDTGRSPSAGGFSLLEHACHLRDYEREGVLARIEQMLAEDGPDLPDFQGTRLAVERRYDTQYFRSAVREFILRRAQTLERVRMLSDHELARTARLGTRGMVTILQLLRLVAEHDAEHHKDIEALLRERSSARDDVMALRQMAAEFTEGFNTGDVDRLMQFYGDTYLDINLRTPVQTHDERRAYFDAVMRSSTRIAVHPDEVVVEGDLAFVRGRIEIRLPDVSAPTGRVKELRYLEIARKSADGSWKAVWGMDGPVQEDGIQPN